MDAERAIAEAHRWSDAVWGERPGFFFFAFGVGGHFTASDKYAFEHWVERYGSWPNDRDRFVGEAIDKAGECDVYVAPYLRLNMSRKKGSALPSDLLYADVDELTADLAGFERLLIGPGGLLVDSGQGRHAYLRLPVTLEPTELERWNRRLAAHLHADAGWAENKVLRLPGTWNHKSRARGGRSTAVAFVEFERRSRDCTLAELDDLLPDPAAVSSSPEPLRLNLRAGLLPPRVVERLREKPGNDRSAQLHAFVGLCLRSGLSEAETVAIMLGHEPTRAKYGDRAAAEITRSISKHVDEDVPALDGRLAETVSARARRAW
jgi:hypothetical protein